MVIEALKAARDFIENDRQALAESLTVNGEIVFEDDIDRGAMAEYVNVLVVIDEALKVAGRSAPTPTDLAAAIEYADARWSGVDVPVEWARHFADAIGKPYATSPAQPAPATPEQLLALAQTASLELDKVIKVFQMAQPAPVQPVQEPVAQDAEQWGRRLNDASWAVTKAWNPDLMGPMTGKIFNNIKDLIRTAILSYLEGYATPPAQEIVCSTGLCHYKAQPAPVRGDSDRINWLTNNPVDALDIFGRIKGADAVRWIRQDIDNAMAAAEKGQP